MLIESPCVVSLTWRLQDAQGNLIDALEEPLEFFYGGEDLFARVEEALEGHAVGDELTVTLEPEHAFGDYDADLVFFEERSLFPAEVEPGMQFEGPPEGAKTEGMPREAIYTVTEVYDTHVVLDGNHPLAGIGLRLEVKVCGVREATAEEVEAGSVADSGITVLQTAPSSDRLH